jgi:preprotein translocase subunit SecA
MLGIFSRFVDVNQKEIDRFRAIVAKINVLEPEIKKYKAKDFAAKTAELRERLTNGALLTELLPEAFALAREASWRTIGKRPYDEQLMAAIALADGKIAEQKTGEGKTLSAVPALYLHALGGKGTHLVTVNDYLARRDAGWNGPIFHLLGMMVGVTIHDEQLRGFVFDPEYNDPTHGDERLAHLRPVERQVAYKSDVIYGTNSEFGFDYLRDNMVQRREDMVQRGHYFAIVDEVDSILIDEARTPLIISAPGSDPTQKYYDFARLVERLSPEDYTIDEKHKTANLTDDGIKKAEKILGVSNLYERDYETIHHLENALRAKTLYLKDKEYVVRDNQVIIVDEFTGRLMFGRRWSEGLHQAVEAKEGVEIQQESRTLATVTIQNYFRMYERLAGMTGTAATEAEEFHKIYKLDVDVLPTHKPMIRADESDLVYKTVKAKYNAVADLIAELHKKGQPILVGTRSIEQNEVLGSILERRHVPHNLLNAKNHEHEAEIIAEAGRKGAVTVATNIAGRGVDIILGGSPPPDPKYAISEKLSEKEYEKQLKSWEKSHEEVVAAGGLYVIGSERHESRRIDNQLRGRSGRQGDPGKTHFYVSLEDEIMRLFGGDQVAGWMTRLNIPEDQPIEHSLINKSIQQAQVKVEGFYFDQRKHLVEYDDVLNKQREIIYGRRKEILQGENLREKFTGLLKSEINNLTTLYAPEGYTVEEVDRMVRGFAELIPFDDASQKNISLQVFNLKTKQAMNDFLTDLALKAYAEREKQLGEVMREVERFAYLVSIDSLWMDHLDAVDDLREGIGLRSYGQRDPLVEYKNEAFQMFERLMSQIDGEVIRRLFRVQIGPAAGQAPVIVEPTPPEVAAPAKVVTGKTANEGDLSQMAAAMSGLTAAPTATVTSGGLGEMAKAMAGLGAVNPANKNPHKGLGRNDPCWCGSGKKYKKCHYPN